MNAVIYPFETPPGIGDGTSVDIGHGVHWLSMPLDSRLAAVNVWAVRDGDDWAVFDTGLRSADTALGWRQTMVRLFKDAPPANLYVTHVHPDHCGMAGWLHEMWGTNMHMSRAEFFMLRMLLEDTTRPLPQVAIDFYRRSGWNREQLDHFHMRFGSLGHMYYPPPAAFTALREGDRIQTGDLTWEVIIGRGHSPEHILYYCADAKLLISGDQVLPTISSNVSIHPQEPCSNPLKDWLETLSDLAHRLPDDVLVLPSHGKPFTGLHQRLHELEREVEIGLNSLRGELEHPKRAVDVFPALFKRPVETEVLVLATGESLAHLSYLRELGEVRSYRDEYGSEWWVATDKQP